MRLIFRPWTVQHTPELEGILDHLQDLLIRLGACLVGVYVHGQRLCHTNGVGHLDQGPAQKETAEQGPCHWATNQTPNMHLHRYFVPKGRVPASCSTNANLRPPPGSFPGSPSHPTR
eukprot:1147098-Pelagomonas_calceolata.AAC.6